MLIQQLLFQQYHTSEFKQHSSHINESLHHWIHNQHKAIVNQQCQLSTGNTFITVAAITCKYVSTYAFSAMTVLVWHQEEYLACKN